jgi:hypothetical protein
VTDQASQPIEEVFGAAIEVEERGGARLAARITTPAEFQGPRGITHGGAVTALLVRLASLHGPDGARRDPSATPLRADVALRGELRVATPVRGVAEDAGGGDTRVRIERPGGRPIAEATVSAARPDDIAALREPVDLEETARLDDARGDEVPGTAMCLACGSENPRGLRLRLRADATHVWRRVRPPATYRTAGGRVFHAFASVLLDEIGWWLGALRSGDCGLTTALSLAWEPALPEDSPFIVLGDRRETLAAPGGRGRFWTSRAALVGASGRRVAAASVLFAASPAYRKVILEDLSWTGDTERLSRLFPRLSR